MRRVAVAALVALAACGSSKARSSAPPPSTSSTSTTSVDVCVRVSSFFTERTLQPSTSATLGATQQDGGHWYVANADGALWLTTVDPSAGTDQSGVMLPLNPQARAAARFGANVQPDDPRLAGFGVDAPRARQAVDCARR